MLVVTTRVTRQPDVPIVRLVGKAGVASMCTYICVHIYFHIYMLSVSAAFTNRSSFANVTLANVDLHLVTF